MPATLFYKVTDSFAGALFVGHSEGDLLFLEQVAVRANTPPHLVDTMVHALLAMTQLSSSTVASPSHIVRFMGQVGIVTPYIEAVPLRIVQVLARVKRIAWPARVALKVALDIVDGLCQYHSSGSALNGGVCPDHILVGSDGDTRVGNVAVPAMPTRESPWRANVHRLAYLAPEQASTNQAYDARTDVYAVGVILWELLSSQPRFIASAAKILETLRNTTGAAQLAPLDATCAAAGLLRALGRALHPQPEARQSTMGALALELLESDLEPADGAEVANFVERVADKPLSAMRVAIRSQAEYLKVRPPSNKPPPPVLRSEPAATQKSVKPSIVPLNTRADSEHTTVYHVTGELLEQAKRGKIRSDVPPPTRSDHPQDNRVFDERTVTLRVSDELLDEANRTVTFQVPEELLQEARRVVEAPDDAPTSNAPAPRDVPDEPVPMARITAQQQLLRELLPLNAPRPELAPQLQGAEDEKTTVWKSQLPQYFAAHRPPTSMRGDGTPVRASRVNAAWLWGIFLCLVTVLIATLLRRWRQG